MNKETISRIIKETAAQLGFESCGIAKAEPLDEDARRLEQWLQKGMQGKMSYMENHFELRVDPCKLVPGARSVITLLHNYYPEEKQDEGIPKIAKYAYGKDYHDVIRNKLHAFINILREKIGNLEARGFVDSAPVLERSWAERSGLGWVGKNGNLIGKKQGSYYFIATLITDLELEYDNPFPTDHCGSCNRCIEACPTEAILPDKVIDARKCICYLTIELKKSEAIPDQFKGKMDNWAFGCDICQDVCPWNRFANSHQEPEFKASPEVLHFTQADWEALSPESFSKKFKESPIARTKWEGMQRNIRFIKNDGSPLI